MNLEDYEDECADLAREVAAERRYGRQLAAHPDPRDPDHPEIDDELLFAAADDVLDGVSDGSARRFLVDGSACSLGDLLDANADDPELCKWAKGASVGERFPAFVDCVRVAA